MAVATQNTTCIGNQINFVTTDIQNVNSNKASDDTDTNSNKQDEKLSREIENLRKKMIEEFKQLCIPKLSWFEEENNLDMDKNFMDLNLHLENGNTREPIKLCNIFDATENGNPKRIVIEGPLGSGKTTLCHKIMYDWANSTAYLQNFKFAVLLFLKKFKKKRMEDEIVDFLHETLNCEYATAKKFLEKQSEDILLILDAFDELPTCHEQSILNVFYKKSCSNYTVVVTCRTSYLNINQDKLGKILGGAEIKPKFWDKKINLEGVSDNSLHHFLHEHHANNDTKDYFKQLRETNGDLCQYPITIKLILTIIEDKMKIEQVTPELNSKTKLYQGLLNCIAKRYLIKEKNVNTDKKVNIFDKSDDENGITNLFFDFGKLCYNKLISKLELKFDDSTTITSIRNAGLVTKDEKTRSKTYKIVHVCFAEIFAAYYLWKEFQKNEFKLNSHLFEMCCDNKVKMQKVWRFFLAFVADMDETLKSLFRFLSPFLPYSFFDLIEEINLKGETFTEFVKCMPTHVTFLPESQQGQAFFLKAIKDNQVKSLEVSSVNDLLNLPRNVVMPKLILNLQKSISEEILNDIQFIQCKSLVFIFYEKNREDNEFEKCRKICQTLQADYLSLKELKSQKPAGLLQLISKKFTDIGKIYSLELNLNIDLETESMLCEVLHTHKVEKLKLRLRCPKRFNGNLAKIALASDSLHIFIVVCEDKKSPLYLDLNEISNRQEQWTKIKLVGISTKCKETISSKIKCFSIEDSQNCESLKSVTPEILECCSSTLDDAMQNNLQLFKSVVHLTLIIDNECGKQCDFGNNLTKFTRLRTLVLKSNKNQEHLLLQFFQTCHYLPKSENSDAYRGRSLFGNCFSSSKKRSFDFNQLNLHSLILNTDFSISHWTKWFSSVPNFQNKNVYNLKIRSSCNYKFFSQKILKNINSCQTSFQLGKKNDPILEIVFFNNDNSDDNNKSKENSSNNDTSNNYCSSNDCCNYNDGSSNNGCCNTNYCSSTARVVSEVTRL